MRTITVLPEGYLLVSNPAVPYEEVGYHFGISKRLSAEKVEGHIHYNVGNYIRTYSPGVDTVRLQAAIKSAMRFVEHSKETGMNFFFLVRPCETRYYVDLTCFHNFLRSKKKIVANYLKECYNGVITYRRYSL